MYQRIYILTDKNTGGDFLFNSFQISDYPVFYTKKIENIEKGMKSLVINSYRDPFSKLLESFISNFNISQNFDLLRFKILENKFDTFINNKFNYDYISPIHSIIFDSLCCFDKINKHKLYHLDSFDLLLLRYDQRHNWEQTLKPFFPKIKIQIMTNPFFNNIYLIFLNKTKKKKEILQSQSQLLDFYFTQEELFKYFS